MNMNKILFLGAFTRRSQAYAQALAVHGLHPQKAIFFGKIDGNQWGQTSEKIVDKTVDGLFNPNFDQSLFQTAELNSWEYETIGATSINDEEIYDILKRNKYDLIIYSGYGGQIVGKKLLSLGTSLLHVHTGYLPKYRGSTTFFYSLIEEGKCGVSALILNEKIDEGMIVAKDYYPAPKGVDADYSYDSIIRAELLVKVIKTFRDTGSFPMEEIQETGGCTYFVIHPLLKHVALLLAQNK